MKQPIVIIGLGEMGSVFARGLLRLGHPMYPVTRQMNIKDSAKEIPEPHLVLVAVAENDFHPVLQQIPEQWQDKLVLLQNELLPRDWQQYPWARQTPPTVISVWFEKKKGQDSKVLIASPIFGPHAQTIKDALATIDIPVKVVESAQQLQLELVIKNVYILTTNIAGLAIEDAANVNDLWTNHKPLAKAVANDVIDLQEHLTQQSFDREKLIKGMLKAMDGDLEHKCMGRSAPARLQRALTIAGEANITSKKLLEINNNIT